FIEFALDHDVLRFGSFTLKSGRVSPYFFNAGAFDTGARLAALGGFYADAIAAADLDFDVMLGPAYKGIPLAAATAMKLSDAHGRDVPWCFNRKEAKDHGEGGLFVGAEPRGRLLVIDDVITAGTAIREVIALVEGLDAHVASVVVAVHRRHRRPLRDPGGRARPRHRRPVDRQLRRRHRVPRAVRPLRRAPAGCTRLSREVRGDVTVGPWRGPWPDDPRLDPQLLREGDTRNVADRYRYWTVEAIVADLDTRRHDLHVAIENWQHDFNIGSIVRTANAFNVAGVHIIGKRRWNRRGAMVTDRYVHVHHHSDAAAFIAWADRERIAVVGVDNLPGAVPLETTGLPRSCVLVFG